MVDLIGEQSAVELLKERQTNQADGLARLRALDPSPIEAFDAMLTCIHTLHVPAAFELEGEWDLAFAQRVENDILDGMEGLLQGRDSVVLESTRDLMEISMLVRKFYHDAVAKKDGVDLGAKDTYQMWVNLNSDYDRSVMFSQLTKAYPEHKLSPLISNEDYRNEYHIHSTSLHPSAFAGIPSALGRGEEELTDRFLIDYTTEILMHGITALIYLLAWFDLRIGPSEHQLDLEVLGHGHRIVDEAVQWVERYATGKSIKERHS